MESNPIANDGIFGYREMRSFYRLVLIDQLGPRARKNVGSVQLIIGITAALI
jgi:hypothetical protein